MGPGTGGYGDSVRSARMHKAMAGPALQEEPDASRQSLRELVRSVYLEEKSGILEVQVASEARRFYFQDGELHLLNGHPLARRMEELLPEREAVSELTPADGVAVTAEARNELKGLLTRIARFLAQLESGDFRFLDETGDIPKDLVGPLPTGYLIMELAVYDQDSKSLLEALGGLEAKLEVRRRARDVQRYYWLDTEEVFLLSRLVSAMPLGVFLTQVGQDRDETLRRLMRLWSLDLIGGVDSRPRGDVKKGDEVTAAVTAKFRERIAQDLTKNPAKLEVEEHRQRLGELLSTLGEQDHYQLLKLRRDAPLEKVHASYEELARIVHPSHASRLGLEGKAQALDFLFERATEAYLTLSDPRRRSLYDQRMDYNLLDEDEEDEEERDRELGREYYRLARRLVDTQQYHAAHELLRDATRRDPRPEYFALLGQVQAKNPNWTRRAVESYRKAVELAPNSVDLRLGLAMTCENGGFESEAKLHYESVIARMPGHPVALEALNRLGGGKAQKDGKAKKKGILSWLFSRGS